MLPSRLQDGVGIAPTAYPELDEEMVKIKQSAFTKGLFSFEVGGHEFGQAINFAGKMLEGRLDT
ncbi:hypothetical protein [Rhizobium leguminosarum]|uniref:hypothetical protein n=1 Tax=Rhizobium leguminosarum TaxID=384 RepID=UPI001C9409AA|nr:hypothetical protein [Rhizobium leguminosarum]MBY5346025.1 hypothetical protein [Rhizobium leguminosarum]